MILDILNWIREGLWANDAKTSKTLWSYQSLGKSECFGGILHHVDRDTLRAVSTYVYQPFVPNKYMKRADSSYDYHICLDHLWALDASQNEKKYTYKPSAVKFTPLEDLKRNHKHSHIITVIRASRWLTKEGTYTGEVLFQKEYDFINSRKYHSRDAIAAPLFRTLVLRLKTISPVGIKWDDEIAALRKRYLLNAY